MTREEAIKEIVPIMAESCGDVRTALSKAIEALKNSERTEKISQNVPNDDLISRKAAIDAADKIIERDTSGSNAVVNAMIAWSEYIRQLPPAQPKVIRCKDCAYQAESWIGIKYCEAHGDHIGIDNDYCSNARRKENG